MTSEQKTMPELSVEREHYLNLLDESFPGIKANIIRTELLGFPWESTPFFIQEKDEILSHVGFLEYPMWIEGKWHKVGALHAICTKKTHRGKGLAQSLIRDVLEWAKTRYEFVVLFTEIPPFYEKLSFRRVQEYRFRLACKKNKSMKELMPLSSPAGDVLLRRCFQNREPLANHLWVKDNGNITAFNSLFATYPKYSTLHYSPSLDAIFSYVLEENTLHLFDIISRKVPSLDTVLDHLPFAFDQIYFYFSPDRLTTDATIAEPLSHDGKMCDLSGYLMVHGNWPSPKPFMIAPLSRC